MRRNSGNNLYSLILVLIFFTGGSLSADSIFQPAATVTLIRTEAITIRQLEDRIRQVEQLSAQAGVPARNMERHRILDSMIAEVLIRQGAERDNITVSSQDLQRFLLGQKQSVEAQMGQSLTDVQFRDIVRQQTGLSWDDYLKGIREQMIQQSYVTQKKRSVFESLRAPTEREISDYFEENRTSFANPEFARVSHIFISIRNLNEPERKKAEEKIHDALRKLRNGAAGFDDLVLEYSEDGQSKFRGGDIGYIARNDARAQSSLGRQFFDTVFSLEAGRISGVISSPMGYHIVRVTERRRAKLLEIDDPIEPGNPMTVREFIRSGISEDRQQRALQRALEELVADLMKEADITIF